MLSPALAESVLRALLMDVPPQRFQHLMRIIRNDYFMLLDPRAMCPVSRDCIPEMCGYEPL